MSRIPGHHVRLRAAVRRFPALKAFTNRALLHPSRGNPLKRPRGVLLLSPPGCGKSQFCKSLGKETGRPVLILDVGSLMGSLVGQSEERRACRHDCGRVGGAFAELGQRALSVGQ